MGTIKSLQKLTKDYVEHEEIPLAVSKTSISGLLATVPASPEALFAAGFLPEVESPRRVFSVPEDVVDALESDLVVEDPDGPVEVFGMTDAAPEEFEGRPVMGRRVVLVPQSADGTPRSHFNVSNSVEAVEVSTLPEIGFTAPESVAGQAPVQSEAAGRSPVAELESGHQSGPPFTGPDQSRTSDTESVVVEERTMTRAPLRRVKMR